MTAQGHAGPRYRCVGPALARVPLRPLHPAGAPASGTAAGVAGRAELAARVEALRSDPLLREAVALASPSAAQAWQRPASALRDKPLRGLAATLSGYASRMRGRATPFGLFAGVALASFEDGPRGQVGASAGHRRVVTTDAAWANALAAAVEQQPSVLDSLVLTANPAVRRSGGRFVLDAPDGRTARVSLPGGAMVVSALEHARRGTGGALLLAALGDGTAAGTARARQVLLTLVRHGYLLSDLAPGTGDLGPLLSALRASGRRADLVEALETFRARMESYACAPLGDTEALGAVDRAAAGVSAAANSGALPPQSVQVDTVLSADIRLGPQVRAEVEAAAQVLARLALPGPAQQIARQVREHGGGHPVPVAELAGPGPVPAVPSAPTEDFGPLLAAYAHALREGAPEIELTDALLDAVAPPSAEPPSDMDVYAVVAAGDAAALARGDFRLVLRDLPATPGAGSALARFAPHLGERGRAARREIVAASDRAALRQAGNFPVAADLLFRPRKPGGLNIARSDAVRPVRISVNNAPEGADALTPDDLLFVPTDAGLAVWSRSLDRPVLPRPASMLVPELTGPPVAGLLARAVSRVRLSGFRWGPLAGAPWLPRVRRGRTVLVPQTWRLDTALTGSGAERADWQGAFTGWRAQWSVPSAVMLVDGDRGMPLDLDDPVDMWCLHRQARRGEVTLQESATVGDCWVTSPDGRHLAEFVFSLVREDSAGRAADGGPVSGGHAVAVLRSAAAEASPGSVTPGGHWLAVDIGGGDARGGPPEGVRAELCAGRSWFLTRLAGGQGWRLHAHGDPSELWQGVLPRLVQSVIGGDPRASVTVRSYRRDAGFGRPPGAPAQAEDWAMADTVCTLRIQDPALGRRAGVPAADLVTLSLLDLSWRLGEHLPADCGSPLPTPCDTGRRMFAPSRRTVLPLLADGTGWSTLARREGTRELLEAWGERGRSAARYLHALGRGPARGARGEFARLLLRQHAERLVGPEAAEAALLCASGADFAVRSWRSGTGAAR